MKTLRLFCLLLLGCSGEAEPNGSRWTCACRAECGDDSATDSAGVCAGPRSDPAAVAHLLELACNDELACEGACVCACIDVGEGCRR